MCFTCDTFKLLGQYVTHEHNQIMESAIYLGEISKRPIHNRNWQPKHIKIYQLLIVWVEKIPST